MDEVLQRMNADAQPINPEQPWLSPNAAELDRKSSKDWIDAQKDAILPGVISGETILSAALTEAGTDPLHPVSHLVITRTKTAARKLLIDRPTAS